MQGTPMLAFEKECDVILDEIGGGKTIYEGQGTTLKKESTSSPDGRTVSILQPYGESLTIKPRLNLDMLIDLPESVEPTPKDMGNNKDILQGDLIG